MAGEAKNPRRAMPIAIIGSIGLCMVIYLFLQTSFLTSLHPGNILDGWEHLSFSHASSPLTGILDQDRQHWMIPLLYVGAVIGPLAAALIYMNGSARLLYGMAQSRYLPKILSVMTRQGNPWLAILVNFVIGMLCFAPLPGWQQMMAFLTSLMAITYSIGPITLIALREQLPEQSRPFKLPFGKLWAFVAFYICTLFTLWTGWSILSKLGIALVIGLLVLFVYRKFTPKAERYPLALRESAWIWVYFAGITLISWLGPFGKGMGVINFADSFWIIALFCLLVTAIAIRFKLSSAQTRQYVEELSLVQQA
ncbi:APC family permease [Dongshaea marina]|uniref:APC family permease n=1 Tax=Dongshaea marina TaxID=2047966 RepID=UPI002D77033A|nr:APC family permease [Dongshaea marina]